MTFKSEFLCLFNPSTLVLIGITLLNVKCFPGQSGMREIYFKIAMRVFLSGESDIKPPHILSKVLTYTEITENKVDIHWSEASDDISTRTELKYRLYCSSSNNITSVTDMETMITGRVFFGEYADLYSATVSGLSPNTTYYCNLVVMDKAGNKASYESKSVTTSKIIDTQPPSVISGNLTFSRIKATQADISWSKALDTLTSPAELKYYLYCSTSDNIQTVSDMKNSGGGRFLVTSAYDMNSYTITGLDVGTYFCNVYVEDKARNTASYTSQYVITKDVYDNYDGTISSKSLGKTYSKCSYGQVWNSIGNTCDGSHNSKQYCSANDNSCNPTGPSWDLDGRGFSELFLTCNQLNLGGKTGWRVMNISEMNNFYSIVLNPNRILFPGIVAAFYLTSSAKSDLGFSGYANAVRMDDGIATDLHPKTSATPVLCVRDGT